MSEINTSEASITNENQFASMRWIVLVFVSLMMFANYYVYDAMSSIKSLMQADLGFSNTDYGLIVSFYSFPNTFLLMALIGGIILDNWGIRKTGMLFVGLTFLGSLFFAFAPSGIYKSITFLYDFMGSFLPQYSPEVKMLMFGRLLFGLGAETSIVVINKILVQWFKGKELALAFALNISIARLGTAAALILSPIFSNSILTWRGSLWIATLLMALGLLSFYIYLGMDKRAFPNQLNANSKNKESFSFKTLGQDLGYLFKNSAYIFVIILCVTFYSAVFPFQSFLPDMLHNKFGFSLESSGILASLIIWGTIIFTPLFGGMVDKYGKRASVMIFGALLLLISHLTLALTTITPYVPLVLLGIAFSLVPAAMWPSVAFLVDEKRLGTAYGFMTSLQNLGLWAFPIVAGAILDKTNKINIANNLPLNYTWTMLMFATLGLMGLLFAFQLLRTDKKYKFGLENK
ncbi:MAG TPA: MFS transporter [Bacteroidota bacterium]|nr:MFS transporter [Bacteroidota bacterium]